MPGGTHDFAIVEGPAAVGGGQGGCALLQVPWLLAALGGAAHGDGVDAVGVAVTGAVVTLSAAVPGCPDENGAQTLPALRGRGHHQASAGGRDLAGWDSPAACSPFQGFRPSGGHMV